MTTATDTATSPRDRSPRLLGHTGPGQDRQEGLWRGLPARQQPAWPDPAALRAVREELAAAPPLTAVPDIRRLEAALARVAAGQAFLLQAGDCAEPMGAAAVAALRGKHLLVGGMAEMMSEATGLPTVTLGRVAGQFAKPRSRPTETVGGVEMEAFRGESVNAPAADAALRVPDPGRMADAYRTSRAVLNEMYILARETAASWEEDPRSPGPGTAPRRPGRAWDGSLRSIVDGYGHTRRRGGTWNATGLWAGHESLLLDYEEPLVRADPLTGERFLTSTHLPWIGERTNRVDEAHVSFHAGIANPVGCKVGPSTAPDDLVRLCAALDPNRRPGRLVLICRLGADRVRRLLPDLVRAVRGAGHHLVWVCDPMHGNTERLGGHKTRRTDRITSEIEGFFAVLRSQGVWPGGVHLEATDGEVTECLGPGGPLDEAGLGERYLTLCDPRLNEKQSFALADTVGRLVAEG
ncbi:3-deoxy-7-phosphoheptulonate synthase [Nocardiopsis algeriensis]|uniref:3-deoxy-7-phosphoheptulonate synthase n=1 Tax=Nocardiopsis algeriensis TaxID=1478215 RepID=UPI003B4386F6